MTKQSHDHDELSFVDEDDKLILANEEEEDDELVFADEDDELVLADEDDEPQPIKEESSEFIESNKSVVLNPKATVWKVMIVDDENEIHEVTQLALEGFSFQGKPINFISAYSGEEAKSLLNTHPDIALIFLDVVMEENDTGLQVAKYIREIQKNQLVRIILRTGQPGHAPEQSVIVNYDINDYKLKVELTQQRLFVTMVAGLRAYYDLMRIELNKIALNQLNEQLQAEIVERQQKEEELRQLNTRLIKLNNAYERFVPRQFLSLLDKQSVIDIQLGDQIEREMTVLFADIRKFTDLSEKMTPQDNFNFLNSYLSKMVPIINQYHGFIDKYIGDAIMALFPTGADDAVQCSITMLKTLFDYNQNRPEANYWPLEIGIGLNTGALMLGTVGDQNRMDGTVISDAVNLASRIESMTKTYGASLLISENAYSCLNDVSQYAIRTIDTVMVKGKSAPVTIYEVFNGEAPGIIDLKIKTLADFEHGLTCYHQRAFNEAKHYFEKILQINAKDKAAQVYLKRCDSFQQHEPPENWKGIEALKEK